MDGRYDVFFGKQLSGTVQVTRQGLYYRFVCRCSLSGDVVCRLHVQCGDRQESLGVVVPMDGGFGLDTRLPVKRLGEGELSFSLRPKHEIINMPSHQEQTGNFIPIYPEEPFAYIEKLKSAYLVRRNGEAGILTAAGAEP